MLLNVRPHVRSRAPFTQVLRASRHEQGRPTRVRRDRHRASALWRLPASLLLVLLVLMLQRPSAARDRPADDEQKKESVAEAQSPRSLVLGPRLRAGGRYDNVRLCVASPAGSTGGPAADISAFVEIPLGPHLGLDIDLPLMRPLLFATAFDMLQFEPSLSLRFRQDTPGRVDPVFGPTLGMSFHYGPDYESEASGSGRGPSFFALGPILGAYGGLDFKRAGKPFNLQLGLTGYVTPLFSIDDPQNHRGLVAGGMLDLSFRFRP